MTEDELLECWLSISHLQDSLTDQHAPGGRYDIASRHKQIVFFGKSADPKNSSADEQSWYADQEKVVRRQVRPQWWLFFATIGAVCAAIITIHVLNSTLIETGKTTAQAQRQADAANTQARIAQEEFVQSKRPWVGTIGNSDLVDITIPYGPVGKKPIPLKFKAIRMCMQVLGPSPARAEFTGFPFFAPPVFPESKNALPDNRLNDCKDAYWRAQGVFDGWMTIHAFAPVLLFPNYAPICPAFPIMETANKDFSKVISQQRKDGKGLYFMGCIDYEGPMHLHYQTQVCRYYNPDYAVSAVTTCPSYDTAY
jgi:hypothetical protein